MKAAKMSRSPAYASSSSAGRRCIIIRCRAAGPHLPDDGTSAGSRRDAPGSRRRDIPGLPGVPAPAAAEAADRSWDEYDESIRATAPAPAPKAKAKAKADVAGMLPLPPPSSPSSSQDMQQQQQQFNHICEFSLSALVGMATMIGEERARVEAERAKTVEALTEALKSAARSETQIMLDLVERARGAPRDANANDADEENTAS